MISNVPQSDATGEWSLHPQLAADCVAAGDLPLSRLLLADDANFPWLILVPRRPNVSEIIDLDENDRAKLFDEIARVSRWLKSHTHCDKLNIAALGNAVPQLHVHVIARFKRDAAWPKPIWGVAAARKYEASERERFLTAIRDGLQIKAI